jgi:DNA-binding MarR family transcriptional regulator
MTTDPVVHLVDQAAGAASAGMAARRRRPEVVGEATPANERLSVPALLRAARRTYGQAMADRLETAGFGDIPRDGGYLLQALAAEGVASPCQLSRDTSVTRQAGSQLIDTLLRRGYVRRWDHPQDRRRTVIQLTDRGRDAAELVRCAVEDVEAGLAELLTPAQRDGFRAGLIRLAGMEAGAGSSAKHG